MANVVSLFGGPDDSHSDKDPRERFRERFLEAEGSSETMICLGMSDYGVQVIASEEMTIPELLYFMDICKMRILQSQSDPVD